MKNILAIVNQLHKEIYHSKDSYYKIHEIQGTVKFQDEFWRWSGSFSRTATDSILQQQNEYINIDAKIKKTETLGKTRTERSVCYNIVSEVQIQDHCDFRKYCHMIAETLVVTHFWTLNVYWTDYYLDRLSFPLPVTKFSQDWIIFFSDIVHDDSWPWYLVAHEARFLKKKKIGGRNLGPTGLK